MRLAVLGAGKMGGILIEAFVKQRLVSPQNIFATVQHAGPERKNGSKLPVSLTNNNRAAVKKADVVFLCVKPQTVGQVVDEIRGELTDKKLLISIAASVPAEYIERRLRGNVPVMRGNHGDRGREIRRTKGGGDSAAIIRRGRQDRGRGRKAHGRGDRIIRERACVYLHHSGIAGGRRRQGGAIA
jgi:hypothetical protein